MDTNNNGIITKTEWKGRKEIFGKLDKNGDGVLSAEDGLPLKKPLSESILVENDIIFKKADNIHIAMDKYMLRGKNYQNAPAVIYIHGGYFMHGDKQDIIASAWFPVIQTLLNKGYICFSINYRLTGDKMKYTIADCVTDCKDAIRFIVKNAHEFAIDTSRIATWGSSAGGHLALMMLLTDDKAFLGDAGLVNYASKIACAVDWFGPTDFREAASWKSSSFPEGKQMQLFGVLAKDNIKLYKSLSPITYLSDKSGPILIIHGDKDTTVRVRQARVFLTEGKKKNLPIEYVEVRNAGHRFLPEGGEMSLSLDDINKRTITFILNNTEHEE